ncbi:type I secretion system permease/ATPase [Limoniibacter endophyticus]|uniref:Type I secretion protein n=1 Tax=Limoniibacter endophyticus TaxID=1565040 RepID=A0A8J3DP28_9HYPH|nr:type I secretion system permease/ATPase [Limoniibacter endophyticus]GHC69667.1 type I secretion protein [Limoniibacter endophyticus]
MRPPQSPSRRSPISECLRSVRSAFVGVAALSGITNLLMLTGPIFMLQIYDRVLASRSVPTLVALSLLTLGLYVYLGILEMLRGRILTRIGNSLQENLNDTTFKATMELPLSGHPELSGAQPVRDLDQLRQFMAGPGPVAIFDMPWLPIYLLIVFSFHILLGWLAVAGAAVLCCITLLSERVLRDKLKKLTALSGDRATFLEAGRRNIETLRSMGMLGALGARWNGVNDKFLVEQEATNDLTATFSSVTKVFRLALQSGVLALGAWLAIRQEVSPGIMIAASILTARALAPIEMAIGQWRNFLGARQAHERLDKVLTLFANSRPPFALPRPARQLDVEHMCTGMPGTQFMTLQNITFSLGAGNGLGIIGPSGSGKSTLARALVGIWPVKRGAIRLDGAELEQWDPELLGPSIGYLAQGVELFDGTIAENISRFRTDASMNAIIEAAQKAGVHELVLSMPNGYDTPIGTGGSMLSAGQRQRIGLARALYGNPFLIVLDEPNSNLDAEGEQALSEAILSAREGGAIVIVIAHRPSALGAVNNVLVIVGGQQTTFGPRDEVLRQTTVQPTTETVQ